MKHALLAVALLGAVSISTSAFAQGGGGGNAAPLQQWWVNKTQGGVYKAPMRPLWKLADLKKAHAGKANWSEAIIKDPEQEATYNSGAPGSKYSTRMHPDTPTEFVVVAGEVNFTIEGQPPVKATRGSLVTIAKATAYSWDVGGGENALWVHVNPANYKTVYPADGPKPDAIPGGQTIKVAFNHTPSALRAPTQTHWNTFEDSIAKCQLSGARVAEDHLFSSPLIGYLNAADNKCGTGNGNIGGGNAPPAAFNPKSTFGHMHAGPAEWWIVQAGQIGGKFENVGEFHAVEGDVLYAAPMMWHQMSAEAKSGVSIRLAMGGYALINMNNTGGGN